MTATIGTMQIVWRVGNRTSARGWANTDDFVAGGDPFPVRFLFYPQEGATVASVGTAMIHRAQLVSYE